MLGCPRLWQWEAKYGFDQIVLYLNIVWEPKTTYTPSRIGHSQNIKGKTNKIETFFENRLALVKNNWRNNWLKTNTYIQILQRTHQTLTGLLFIERLWFYLGDQWTKTYGLPFMVTETDLTKVTQAREWLKFWVTRCNTSLLFLLSCLPNW